VLCKANVSVRADNLTHGYETAVTGNSHTRAVWPAGEHNRQIPMYSFIQRFHKTKFPVTVSYHKQHCSYMILYSFCFTNAKPNGRQLRCENKLHARFSSWNRMWRNSMYWRNRCFFFFRDLRHCRQPIKITMSVHSSGHTHEITIKTINEFS
jgi:hypothetical protein